MGSPADVIKQLNAARDIVLKDPNIYPQVVPGVLPLVGSSAHVELRRWGADFLAETFASQVVTADAKQSMCLGVLDTLGSYLHRKENTGEDEDPSVVKSAVQCATSIYPYVFRHTVSNPSDSETWGKMAGMKSSILRRMDTAEPGVRICCIKFVTRVVQIQTPGVISDPRRQDQNDISLALVPREHPVIPPSNLQAEASGLLDRLLGVLQDNTSDALIVTATLNSLSALVYRRASISQKIIGAVLNFDPLAISNRPLSAKDKVAIRSMTRTAIVFLHNIAKRMPAHPSLGRLEETAKRLRHGLEEALSERSGKRPAMDEPTDGLDERKRQKIDYRSMNGTAKATSFPSLPSGPVTYHQLFTVSQDPSIIGFHVEAIPVQTVTQLLVPLLQSIPHDKVELASNVVRKRYLDLSMQPASPALNSTRVVGGDEEDDDYDPMATFPGTEQVLNRLDQLGAGSGPEPVALGPFHLPPPPPWNEAERQEHAGTMLNHVFGTLGELDQEAKAKGAKKADGEKGFDRLLGASHDSDGWIALITRMATRADPEPEEGISIKKENAERSLVKKGRPQAINDKLRQSLMSHVMGDFRRRIDVAIAWLNEEWYSDRMRLNQEGDAGRGVSEDDDLPHYWGFALRLLDSITPYLDVKDSKTLIRLLSEIPQLNQGVMDRLKSLANDPEKVQITTQVLLYLSMFRPPAREMAVNTAEALWRENSDAKTGAAKVLQKWRPEVLAEVKKEVKTEA